MNIEMPSGKKMLAGGALLLGLYTLSNSFLMTDAGYTYVHQNNISGELAVYTEPGIHARVPFFSKVTEYKQVVTVSYGNSTGEDFYERLPAIQARFADTYTGTIPVTFRFRLSKNEEEVKKMHREFRNFNNLIDNLLIKNARNVSVITATMYTGEEFFQGGLNAFKSKLNDQLKDGVYLTERRQVEVEQVELAPVGLNQADSNKLQRTKQLVWKTVPVEDNATGLPIREINPLAQYGIEVTQVTIGDPQPENQLITLLSDKKKLVADRIRTIQEQETSKARAETEQLKKEIQRTREVQDEQRKKELAIIAQQKEVEVARQIAEKEIVEVEKTKQIAEVNKERELAIAEANLNIQKANSLSAEYEAKAILAKGKAEAAILKAKYDAKGANREVYLAEIHRDISKSMYRNLQNFKVEMPRNYFGGGDAGSMTSNLDIITGMGAIGIMDKSEKMATPAK